MVMNGMFILGQGLKGWMTFLPDNAVYHKLTNFDLFFFSTILFKRSSERAVVKVRQMNMFQSASETVVQLALDALTEVYLH
jgi:hypothetical protein